MIKLDSPKMTIPQYLEEILKELKKLNENKTSKGPKKKVDPEIEAIIDEWEKNEKKIEKRKGKEKKSILDIF